MLPKINLHWEQQPRGRFAPKFQKQKTPMITPEDMLSSCLLNNLRLVGWFDGPAFTLNGALIYGPLLLTEVEFIFAV